MEMKPALAAYLCGRLILLQHPLIVYSSLDRGGAPCHFPHLNWHFYWCYHFSGLFFFLKKTAIFLRFCGYGFPIISRRQSCSRYLGILALASFPPLPQCCLSLRGRRCIVNMSLSAKHTTVPFSLHLDKLWISIVVFYSEKKLL